MPIIATGIAKAGDRSYNNRMPRDWLAKQTGMRARANAAQANSWEALIVFGLALLSAVQRGANAGTRGYAGDHLCRGPDCLSGGLHR